MALEPLPYYRWLVRDYRANRKVQRMGYLAKGFYRELLDEAWLEGSLPIDMESLADICGCPVEVLQQAWAEIAPCFEERDGRLFNSKLESQRTDKDAERVKRAHAGRAGALAKQVLANAKQPPASASKCHIAEQSIEKKRREKPSRRQAASEPKHSTDPRHVACKDLIFAEYRQKNGIDPPWDGREGKALGMLLGAWPSVTVEGFKRVLGHWARSEVVHADRPGIWIPKLSSFLRGPVDRFHKPLDTTKTNQGGAVDFDGGVSARYRRENGLV